MTSEYNLIRGVVVFVTMSIVGFLIGFFKKTKHKKK